MKSGIDLWQPRPSNHSPNNSKRLENDTCDNRIPHALGGKDGAFPVPANVILNVRLDGTVGNVAQRFASGDDGLSLHATRQVMFRRHFRRRDVDRNVELVFNLRKCGKVIDKYSS